MFSLSVSSSCISIAMLCLSSWSFNTSSSCLRFFVLRSLFSWLRNWSGDFLKKLCSRRVLHFPICLGLFEHFRNFTRGSRIFNNIVWKCVIQIGWLDVHASVDRGKLRWIGFRESSENSNRWAVVFLMRIREYLLNYKDNQEIAVKTKVYTKWGF